MPEAPNRTVLITIKNQKRSNRNVIVNVLFAMAAFKPDEAASLLAKRFNMTGWIYK